MDGERRITFISDRHPGIIEAVQKYFPHCHHSYCLFHMKYSLMDKRKGVHTSVRNRIVYLFTQCAYAANYEQCHANLDLLYKEGGQRVKDFVTDIPLHNWCNALSLGKGMVRCHQALPKVGIR